MKKKMKMWKKVVIGIVAFMAIVSIFGKGDVEEVSKPQPQEKPVVEEVVEEPEVKKVEKKKESKEKFITLENFEKLEIGMSYESVCEILNSKGKLSSESAIGSKKIKTYTFQDEGALFENIVLSFIDDKLQTKMQMGLDD